MDIVHKIIGFATATGDRRFITNFYDQYGADLDTDCIDISVKPSDAKSLESHLQSALRIGKDIVQDAIKGKRIQLHDKAVYIYVTSMEQPIVDADVGDGNTENIQMYEGWRASAVGDESVSFSDWYTIIIAWRRYAPLKESDKGDLIENGVRGFICRISPPPVYWIQRLEELLTSEEPVELIQTVNGIEVRRRDITTLLPDNDRCYFELSILLS